MIHMALKLRIEVKNLEQVNRKISRIDSRFINMNITDFAKRIAGRARLNLRSRYVRDRPQTGQLLESIHVESENRGKTALVIVDATNKGFHYGVPVEVGRRAMTARAGKAFRFMGREGFPVYARHVKAAAAKHYMRDAAEWGAMNIRNYMDRRIKRIIQSGGTVT